MKILNSLKVRLRLLLAIMKLIASYLGDDVSIRLKKAALAIFHGLYEALLDEVVQAAAALSKDPDKDVRSAAAEALGRQSALPEAVQAVAALLKDPHDYIRSAAAGALGQQSALPDKIV